MVFGHFIDLSDVILEERSTVKVGFMVGIFGLFLMIFEVFVLLGDDFLYFRNGTFQIIRKWIVFYGRFHF